MWIAAAIALAIAFSPAASSEKSMFLVENSKNIVEIGRCDSTFVLGRDSVTRSKNSAVFRVGRKTIRKTISRDADEQFAIRNKNEVFFFLAGKRTTIHRFSTNGIFRGTSVYPERLSDLTSFDGGFLGLEPDLSVILATKDMIVKWKSKNSAEKIVVVGNQVVTSFGNIVTILDGSTGNEVETIALTYRVEKLSLFGDGFAALAQSPALNHSEILERSSAGTNRYSINMFVGLGQMYTSASLPFVALFQSGTLADAKSLGKRFSKKFKQVLQDRETGRLFGLSAEGALSAVGADDQGVIVSIGSTASVLQVSANADELSYVTKSGASTTLNFVSRTGTAESFAIPDAENSSFSGGSLSFCRRV